MGLKIRSENIVIFIFLIGILACLYYLFNLFGQELSEINVIEKTILVIIIICILIALTFTIRKQIHLKNELENIRESMSKTKTIKKRSAEDVRKEIMRIYRDMGALKIILNDNLISKADYEAERKVLEKKVKELKKEYERLKGR